MGNPKYSSKELGEFTKKSLIILYISILLISGCTESVQKQTIDHKSQIANPASVYCEDQGGTLEIRTNEDGSQTGYCIFDDGTECEEWKFYRGECEV